jgi:chaperonin cofactor prefoldin
MDEMVNPSVASEVLKILEAYENLNRMDFIMTKSVDPNDIENEILTIQYRPDPTYEFMLTIAPRTMWTSIKPGRFRAVDYSSSIDNEQEVFDAIQVWAQRLNYDIASLPALRRVALVEQELAKYDELISKLPNEYLSVHEAEVLKERLSKIEEGLANQIRQTTNNQEELEEKLAVLKAEIELLKKQTESLKKPGIIRAMLLRLGMTIATQDPKSLAAGTQTILRAAEDMSHLLPPDIGNTIGEGAGHVADALGHLKDLR